jgi:hypothetical protein
LRIQNKTLANQERVASAQYVLQLSNELNSTKYSSIMNAIEGGTEYTSLSSKGAYPYFTYTQVENYIGNFETIGDLVNEGVIDKDMAYQEFDPDVMKAWCNEDVRKDVQGDIASNQTQSGEDQYWNGFSALAKLFMKMDHQTSCKYYDTQ